ncbi:zinc finger Ran-binding domain-containing protein [Candidatus Dependentiae bacterium]
MANKTIKIIILTLSLTIKFFTAQGASVVDPGQLEASVRKSNFTLTHKVEDGHTYIGINDFLVRVGEQNTVEHYKKRIFQPDWRWHTLNEEHGKQILMRIMAEMSIALATEQIKAHAEDKTQQNLVKQWKTKFFQSGSTEEEKPVFHSTTIGGQEILYIALQNLFLEMTLRQVSRFQKIEGTSFFSALPPAEVVVTLSRLLSYITGATQIPNIDQILTAVQKKPPPGPGQPPPEEAKLKREKSTKKEREHPESDEPAVVPDEPAVVPDEPAVPVPQQPQQLMIQEAISIISNNKNMQEWATKDQLQNSQWTYAGNFVHAKLTSGNMVSMSLAPLGSYSKSIVFFINRQNIKATDQQSSSIKTAIEKYEKDLITQAVQHSSNQNNLIQGYKSAQDLFQEKISNWSYNATQFLAKVSDTTVVSIERNFSDNKNAGLVAKHKSLGQQEYSQPVTLTTLATKEQLKTIETNIRAVERAKPKPKSPLVPKSKEETDQELIGKSSAIFNDRNKLVEYHTFGAFGQKAAPGTWSYDKYGVHVKLEDSSIIAIHRSSSARRGKVFHIKGSSSRELQITVADETLGGIEKTISGSAAAFRWACSACTFINPSGNNTCQICGTAKFGTQPQPQPSPGSQPKSPPQPKRPPTQEEKYFAEAVSSFESITYQQDGSIKDQFPQWRTSYLKKEERSSVVVEVENYEMFYANLATKAIMVYAKTPPGSDYKWIDTKKALDDTTFKGLLEKLTPHGDNHAPRLRHCLIQLASTKTDKLVTVSDHKELQKGQVMITGRYVTSGHIIVAHKSEDYHYKISVNDGKVFVSTKSQGSWPEFSDTGITLHKNWWESGYFFIRGKFLHFKEEKEKKPKKEEKKKEEEEEWAPETGIKTEFQITPYKKQKPHAEQTEKLKQILKDATKTLEASKYSHFQGLSLVNSLYFTDMYLHIVKDKMRIPLSTIMRYSMFPIFQYSTSTSGNWQELNMEQKNPSQELKAMQQAFANFIRQEFTDLIRRTLYTISIAHPHTHNLKPEEPLKDWHTASDSSYFMIKIPKLSKMPTVFVIKINDCSKIYHTYKNVTNVSSIDNKILDTEYSLNLSKSFKKAIQGKVQYLTQEKRDKHLLSNALRIVISSQPKKNNTTRNTWWYDRQKIYVNLEEDYSLQIYRLTNPNNTRAEVVFAGKDLSQDPILDINIIDLKKFELTIVEKFIERHKSWANKVLEQMSKPGDWRFNGESKTVHFYDDEDQVVVYLASGEIHKSQQWEENLTILGKLSPETLAILKRKTVGVKGKKPPAPQQQQQPQEQQQQQQPQQPQPQPQQPQPQAQEQQLLENALKIVSTTNNLSFAPTFNDFSAKKQPGKWSFDAGGVHVNLRQDGILEIRRTGDDNAKSVYSHSQKKNLSAKATPDNLQVIEKSISAVQTENLKKWFTDNSGQKKNFQDYNDQHLAQLFGNAQDRGSLRETLSVNSLPHFNFKDFAQLHGHYYFQVPMLKPRGNHPATSVKMSTNGTKLYHWDGSQYQDLDFRTDGYAVMLFLDHNMVHWPQRQIMPTALNLGLKSIEVSTMALGTGANQKQLQTPKYTATQLPVPYQGDNMETCGTHALYQARLLLNEHKGQSSWAELKGFEVKPIWMANKEALQKQMIHFELKENERLFFVEIGNVNQSTGLSFILAKPTPSAQMITNFGVITQYAQILKSFHAGTPVVAIIFEGGHWYTASFTKNNDSYSVVVMNSKNKSKEQPGGRLDREGINLILYTLTNVNPVEEKKEEKKK